MYLYFFFFSFRWFIRAIKCFYKNYETCWFIVYFPSKKIIINRLFDTLTHVRQKVTRKACFVAKYCNQSGLHGPHPQDTSASSNSVWRLFDLSSGTISLPFSVPPIPLCSFPFDIKPLLLCCCWQVSPFPFAIFGGMIASASTLPFDRICMFSPAIIPACFSVSTMHWSLSRLFLRHYNKNLARMWTLQVTACNVKKKKKQKLEIDKIRKKADGGLKVSRSRVIRVTSLEMQWQLWHIKREILRHLRPRRD